MLGSFAHAIVKTIDLFGPPRVESDMKIASKDLQEKRGAWLYLRMVLGGILGLVIGLYFIGSIQQNVATISKILAFSILAGYSAPKIWEAQDKIVAQKVGKLVQAELLKNTHQGHENDA